MSYTIEYNQVVYYLDLPVPINGENRLYFLFIRQGDNNVWVHDNSQRAKDWYFATKGTIGELWKYIGKRAGSTFGGGLQKAKGWTDTEYFSIEEYIKKYRSRIKNAKPLAKMLEQFSISASIMTKEPMNELVESFVKKYDMNCYGSHWYDKERKDYSCSIDSFSTLYDFLINLPKRENDQYYVQYHLNKKA